MWFRAAFRAKTSPPPELAQGSPEHAPDCGSRCSGSSKKSPPNGCLSRIPISSLEEGSARFRQAYRKRVTLMSLVSCPPDRAVRGICGSDAGSSGGVLRTLTASDAHGRSGSGYRAKGGQKKLTDQIFPTLTASAASRGKAVRGKNAQGGPSLMEALMPTLTATNAHGNGYTRDRGVKGKERPTLVGVCRMLPTLSAADVKGRSGAGHIERHGMKRLSDALLPTLTASMVTVADMEQAAHHSSSRPEYRSGGGRLNPEWCEWFMGWPMGWTAFGSSETGRFRAWRRQHSPCCPGN